MSETKQKLRISRAAAVVCAPAGISHPIRTVLARAKQTKRFQRFILKRGTVKWKYAGQQGQRHYLPEPTAETADCGCGKPFRFLHKCTSQRSHRPHNTTQFGLRRLGNELSHPPRLNYFPVVGIFLLQPITISVRAISALFIQKGRPVSSFTFETAPKIVCEQGGIKRLGEMSRGLGIRHLFLVTMWV